MASRVCRWVCGMSLLAALALVGTSRGQTAPATAAATEPKPMAARSDTVVTTGTLRPSGRGEMTYTATAGYLPLKDERDKLRANIFFVAYTAGSPPATTQAAPASAAAARPIVFTFNGGPGAAAVWLHLGAVGPRRLDVPPDGAAPAAPYRVIDNDFSWLPAADLVLVDPVNTGYSRAATPEQAREFFGVQEDISAMGEFIRMYLTKYQRWGSPVFLAGESYGTTRAAGLSNYLQERMGVSVSGVILISTVLNFASLSPGEGNDLPYALYLPSYSAVAWYHKKLDMNRYKDFDALLKESEAFAVTDYTVALARGAALPAADRQKTAQRLAELTGLAPAYVLSSNLRVPPNRFEKELLRNGLEGKIVGRFDGRITGAVTDAINDSPEYDPSLTGFYEAYASAFNDYVRRTLKYENDLQYEVLSGRTQPWNFGGGNGFLYIGDALRDAMTHNPHLRLLVCSGRFDLATPYFATDYTLSHMALAPEIRKNITQAYYPGGHMVYHVRPGLEKLYHDVTAFIAGP